MNFLKKFKIISLILVILATSLFFAAKYLIPYFAKDEIKKALQENFGSKIKIENLSFNPLKLKFQINNVKINHVLSLKKLDIKFDFPNFFSKKITISKVLITGIEGGFTRKNNKIFIEGISQKEQNNSEINNLKQDNSGQNILIQNSSWSYIVKKIEILDSNILFNKNHNIKVKKLIIENINWPSFEENAVNIKALFSLDETEILISAKFEKSFTDIDFQLENLGLNIVSDIINEENPDFGKISGNLSSKGSVKIENGKISLSANLNLQKILLYSQDLKSIDYFIEKLDLENLQLNKDSQNLKINLSNLDIKNLLLAPAFEKTNAENFFATSRIKIRKAEINHNQNQKSTSLLVNFANGGYFAANQYKANDEKILDAKARNINLAEFSNSFESILNYHIESGKFALDLKKVTKSGKVNGKTQVIFRQLNLDSKNQFGEKIENESLIPLKAAIAIAKDDNGILKLDFNISGNEDDLNFSILQMLTKEAGSMVASKIVSVIANKAAIEFVPLLASAIPVSPNNLLFFTNGVYKFATKARFSNIEFELQNSEIKESSKPTLNKVVNLLEKNKKISLKICLTAAINEFNDEEVDNDKILNLANERALVIKNFLAKRLDGKWLDRVIFCRPTISKDNSNIAKAEISI